MTHDSRRLLQRSPRVDNCATRFARHVTHKPSITTPTTTATSLSRG